MASRVNARIQRLLADRRLIRANITREMVLKEIGEAENDMKEADDSLKRKKYKWATIQGYYSIFHSARALLYSKGFREKSHYALFLALQEFFKNELQSSLIQSFEEAMNLRQEADYGLKFSEEGAKETVEGARKFFKRTKEILKMGP